MMMRSDRKCLSKEELINLLENPEERCNVEDHLLDCELCSEAVDNLAGLPEAAYHIDSLEQEIKIKYNSGSAVSNRSYWYYSAAASFFLILFTYLVFFSTSRNEELFADYYKPYPNVIPMVRGEGIDFDLKAAMVLYNSNNFGRAVVEFDKVLSIDPDNETAEFYKAVSLLSLEEYSLSISLLKRIMDNPEAVFMDQAEWYAGLAYIAINDETAADSLFQRIIERKNYYSKRSAEVLSKMKSDD
jgi:hypothetical protein